ncbi:MAG: hypothetical protein L3J36_03095 [Rhodobacteraceae bacterium]|nr:hypothetical protein [Paracoccaceae bacterium]
MNPQMSVDEILGPDLAAVESPDLVSAAELGEWLGLTSGRVNQISRDGILPRQSIPGGYGFNLKECVRTYAEYLRSRKAQTDPELAAEKLRLTKAQADRAEQQAAKDRGELLPAVAVAKTWTSTLTDLRAAFLAIPERLASDLSLDPATTQAVDAEIRTTLETLADD